MATPTDPQSSIASIQWTNGRGLVTGAMLLGVMTIVLGIFGTLGSWSSSGVFTPNIPPGAITSGMLAPGVSAANIGYPPMNPSGATMTGPLRYGTPPADQPFTASGLNYGISGAANLAVFSDSNTAPAGTVTFPTAVTAAGFLHSPGGQVFAIYAPAYCYTAGVCTSEIDTFNFATDAPAAYPWNRGLGTPSAVPVNITCAFGGPKLDGACIEIASEGSTLGHGRYGIVEQAGAVTQAGLYFDATATLGPVNTAVFRNSGAAGNTNLILQTMGAPAAGGAVLNVTDSTSKSYYSVDQLGNQVSAGFTLQSSGLPDARMRNTSATVANTGLWSTIVDAAGTVHLRAANDTLGATNDAYTITRTGNQPRSFALGAGVRYNAPLSTPASSSAPCNPGDFTDDTGFHYVCVAANQWKRVALAAF